MTSDETIDQVADDPAVDRPADSTPLRVWIGQGWSITRRHVLWILFPLLTGLLSIVPVVRALGHEDVSVNPTPTFPGPIVDLWPLIGIRVLDVSEVLTPTAAVLLGLPTVVTVLFAGAYLGTLNDLLEHRRPSIRRNVVRFGLPLGVYTLLWDGLLATIFGLGAVSLPAGGVAFVVFLALAYRLWATPFLVVAGDLSLLTSVRRAWQLSSGSTSYRRFSLLVLLTTLVLSAPRVYAVLEVSPLVLVASVVVLAPVAMLLTVASLAFVRSAMADAAPDPSPGDRST